MDLTTSIRQLVLIAEWVDIFLDRLNNNRALLKKDKETLKSLFEEISEIVEDYLIGDEC